MSKASYYSLWLIIFCMIHTPLQVMESHQATKLDVSGTAKAVISCFQKLGVSFDMDEVLQRTFAVNE